MAHAHESNLKRIWVVFGILTIITLVEVALGIYKPEFLYLNSLKVDFHWSVNWFFNLITFAGTSPLNWIFIILTLVKAYYITWAFMHMEGETKWLRRSVVWTAIFLVSYLVTLMLIEGNYLHSTLAPLVKW